MLLERAFRNLTTTTRALSDLQPATLAAETFHTVTGRARHKVRATIAAVHFLIATAHVQPEEKLVETASASTIFPSTADPNQQGNRIVQAEVVKESIKSTRIQLHPTQTLTSQTVTPSMLSPLGRKTAYINHLSQCR